MPEIISLHHRDGRGGRLNAPAWNVGVRYGRRLTMLEIPGDDSATSRQRAQAVARLTVLLGG